MSDGLFRFIETFHAMNLSRIKLAGYALRVYTSYPWMATARQYIVRRLQCHQVLLANVNTIDLI